MAGVDEDRDLASLRAMFGYAGWIFRRRDDGEFEAVRSAQEVSLIAPTASALAGKIRDAPPYPPRRAD